MVQLASLNLAEIFETVADSVPKRLAFIGEGIPLTYRQLDERADRVARVLRAGGIGPGDHIGINLYNCSEHLEVLLASLKIRAVPIGIDFSYSDWDLERLLDDANVKLIVTEPDHAPLVKRVTHNLPLIQETIVRGYEYEQYVLKQRHGRPFSPNRSGNDHYIVYTGGATAPAKGFVCHHKDVFFGPLGGGNPGGPALIEQFEFAQHIRLYGGQVMLTRALVHGAGQWQALGALTSGRTVVAHAGPFDPDPVWQVADTDMSRE
jgi:acyl-CoA synthetase (AMP-forming)/AMP-acid ligase II